MRIDKFLKVSRLLKRRTVAASACDGGRVMVNDKVSKPGHKLKVGDVVTLIFGEGSVKFRVLVLNEKAGKADAADMYEILEDK